MYICEECDIPFYLYILYIFVLIDMGTTHLDSIVWNIEKYCYCILDYAFYCK